MNENKIKYIRTKEGAIYPIVENKFLIFDNTKVPIDVNKLAGYETADTIKDLCDCFVVVFKNGKKQGHTRYFNYEVAKQNCEENETLYGAIWTDKGLIYVAKMNEKGELELI